MAFRRPLLKCDGYSLDGRGITVKCQVMLTPRSAHRVIVSEEDLAGSLGRDTVGLYCERHCPGNCQNFRCQQGPG
jgi:hypothetical protein